MGRKMAKKLRCYLYTRVSTGIQVDGYSLEAQKERLEKEAIHRGMKVVGTYSDEGKSGKNVTGRPEFQRMLADIQSGKDEVDYVLVFKLSRFGRNAADTLNSLQFMEDYGVNLYCVEDNIDSAGAAGKLMISVVAAVAEIERENIHEQTMAGRRQKARDGRWNGGFAPYGYTLVPRDGERGKVLEINEKEAELVRIIFDKFANTDMGCNAVAKWLNDHGYTKEVRQNGTLSNISSNFVKLVIDNPVYMGKIAYGRRKTEKIEGKRNEYHVVKQAEDAYELYQGIHEAIVSEELWQKAHAKRLVTGVKYDKVHDTGHCHILSGLLRCPECGAKMYGVVNRKKKAGSDDFYKDMWYYKCKNRIKVEGHFCTYKTHIRQDIVNAEVISIVKYALNDEEFKRRIAQKAGGKEDGSLDELVAEKTRLEETKKKLEIRKKKMLDKIGNMDVDDELYDTLFEDYMGVVRELTEKLAKLDADLLRNNIAIENMQKQTFTAEQYYELLDAIVRYMEEIPENRIKQLMGLVLDKVELFPKRQANGRWVRNVRFKVPLDVDGTFYDSIGFRGDGEEKSEEDGSVYFLPNETHDETVVLLSQQKPDDTIEIDLDLDELDATSAETKATYQEIKDYVLKEFGLKVSNLYISQIKRKCGIEVGENYNLPKTENPKVPQCPKEKEDAIKAALKYFAMI